MKHASKPYSLDQRRQGRKERKNGARHENHTSRTGHVTSGLKPGSARGLQKKT